MEIDATFLAVIVPVVTILVRLIRALPYLASREAWLPAVSVAVGLVISGSWTAWRRPADLGLAACVGYAVLHGVLAGLAASGLWSVAAKYTPLLKV